MENNLENRIKDIEKDCPKYAEIARREQRLRKLEEEIKLEQDHKERYQMLETYMDLSKQNNIELLAFAAERLQISDELVDRAIKISGSYEKQCQKLVDKIQEERKEYEEFYYNFCGLMVNKPRIGFETILAHIERNEKTMDQSGDGWQWTLKFPFFARLRMAVGLLFGSSCNMSNYKAGGV